MQSRNLVNNFSIPTDINLILLLRLSMYVTVYPWKLAEPIQWGCIADTTTKGGNATLDCQKCAENVNTRTRENFYLHHARHKPLPWFVVFISKHVFSIQEYEPHDKKRERCRTRLLLKHHNKPTVHNFAHVKHFKKRNPYSWRVTKYGRRGTTI